MDIPISFVAQTCIYARCGIVFAMTKEATDLRKRDHSIFFCPNGHEQHYSGESDLEKETRLRKEAEQRILQSQAATNEARHEAEVLKRQIAAGKGQLTRVKNRIARGVCTCCNRTFQNLANHMKTEHPQGLDPGHERKQLTA